MTDTFPLAPPRWRGMPDTGALPEYIPPHLQGEVMDFRNEEGGEVSFYHPEASLGLDRESSRIRLTPEQYKNTFDEQHRLGNFTEAMNNQYTLRTPKTPGRRMNDWIGGNLRGAYDWGTSTQGKGVGTAGLLAALGGGLGGYLWGNYTGKGKIRKALLGALLAGGVGAGVAALSQGRHNRREAYLGKRASVEVSSVLIRALENDVTLGRMERAMLLRQLAQVPAHQRSDMYRLMRTTIGAGAGMLVMRFLKAKGLLPMMAGAILGGIVGSVRDPGPQRNPWGRFP